MVNPGGTGSPALVISARPAPLPPSTSFILPLPSALPPPNEYTYLVADGLFVVFFSFTSASGRVIVAMDKSFVVWSDSNSLKLQKNDIVPLGPKVRLGRRQRLRLQRFSSRSGSRSNSAAAVRTS